MYIFLSMVGVIWFRTSFGILPRYVTTDIWIIGDETEIFGIFLLVKSNLDTSIKANIELCSGGIDNYLFRYGVLR